MTPVFPLAAILAYDPRPCAIGQRQWLIHMDDWDWLTIGDLGRTACSVAGRVPRRYDRHSLLPPPDGWNPAPTS